MGRVKVTGAGEWTLQLERLASPATARRIAKKAVYDGAKVMKNAILEAVKKIPETHDKTNRKYGTGPWWGTEDWPQKGLTAAQKQGLLEGFGIAPIKKQGGVYSTKTSFTGFNSVTTKIYPQGQPNSLVVARMENGSSFHQRDPYISQAIKRAKASAEAAMAATGEAEIQKLQEE